MAPDRSLAMSFPAVLVACGLSIASGCSLGIQAADPDRPRNEVPKCDTSKGPVGLDGVMGSLLGLASLASFAGDEIGGGVVLGGLSALFVASAIRGNNAADSCSAAYDEYKTAYEQARRQQLAIDEEPASVVVPKQPKPKPPVPPVETEPRAPQPDPAPAPVEPATYATPRPPPSKPVAKPPVKSPDEDDWSSFWKEAP